MRRAKGGYKDGYYFGSKIEMERYDQLVLLQRADAIINLKVHPSFVLLEPFIDKMTGKRIQGITYIADFSYERREHKYVIVEDVKGGPLEPVFKLKFRLFRKLYPTIDFRIVERKDM